MPEQLTLLNFTIKEDATFATFYPGGEQMLIPLLEQFALFNGEQFIYLWGAKGVGKSHLLQACCHYAQQQGLMTMYLPLQEIIEYSSDVLTQFANIDLLCIDDVQLIKAKPAWQEALFDLYNQLRDQEKRLLVAEDKAVKTLAFTLKDLDSRLCWGDTIHLHELSEKEKIHILQQRALQRGFELSVELCQFLLTRCSREMGQLIKIFDQLDKAALMEKRRLTIPFVKSILGI